MDISDFVNLTSKAWTLPILGALKDGVPGRQAQLIRAVGAGRTAFGESLQHLVELDLIMRNPGHGHPLRPEFVLTKRGRQVAGLASHTLSVVAGQERGFLRRKWTLPTLAALREPRYFKELSVALSSASDRAISITLHELEARRWVSRSAQIEQRPLRPIYHASNIGLVMARDIRTVILVP